MCELITLPGGGTAFVCGGHAPDHQCNEDCVVLLLDDGTRVLDTEANQKQYADRVRGGSVACTVCGHAAIDEAPFYDI